MKRFARMIAILALATAGVSAFAQSYSWGNFSIGDRHSRISGGFSQYDRGYGGYGYNRPMPPSVPRYEHFIPQHVYRHNHGHYRDQRLCMDDYRARCYADRRYGSTYSCDVPPVAVRQACMR
ncbi:hypothetical protein [Delftia phage PhiW-14]|uniref:Uncharacterized protein n=1 Tax=Delftia phage PhiW-14 TaxID=665032 RepID=C9DG66_BPW14|nr:hypothetical protein DP-phiW-14_gp096 [Delftia phage PhiW-14]ACV50117.1 hypothetical protein [Delftia phage PhiW-14]